MSRTSLASLTTLLRSMSSDAAAAASAPAVAEAPKPAAPAAGAEQGNDDEAVVSTADAVIAANQARTEGYTAGRSEGIAAGAKAANERMTAVLGSDAGKANVAMAAFLLTNTNAAADAIIGQLASMPGAAAAPAGAAAGAAAAAAPAAAQTMAERIAATTPALNLGGGSGAHGGDDRGAAAAGGVDDIWASIVPGKAGESASIAQGGLAGQGHTWGGGIKGMEGVNHGC